MQILYFIHSILWFEQFNANVPLTSAYTESELSLVAFIADKAATAC